MNNCGALSRETVLTLFLLNSIATVLLSVIFWKY